MPLRTITGKFLRLTGEPWTDLIASVHLDTAYLSNTGTVAPPDYVVLAVQPDGTFSLELYCDEVGTEYRLLVIGAKGLRRAHRFVLYPGPPIGIGELLGT